MLDVLGAQDSRVILLEIYVYQKDCHVRQDIRQPSLGAWGRTRINELDWSQRLFFSFVCLGDRRNVASLKQYDKKPLRDVGLWLMLQDFADRIFEVSLLPTSLLRTGNFAALFS